MAAIWECPLGRATPDSACESGCSPQLYVESLIAQKRLVWNGLPRGKRADLPTISSFQSGVRAPDRAEVFDDRCAEQSHSVSGDELAQRAFRLSCVHSPGALRQPAAPLTIAPMTAVTSASPAALRYENGSRFSSRARRCRSVWLRPTARIPFLPRRPIGRPPRLRRSLRPSIKRLTSPRSASG